MASIAQIIRDLRNQRGWTQEEFAKRLNVTKQTVNNYEHARRRPDVDMLKTIAEVLGVPAEIFMAEDDRKISIFGVAPEPRHLSPEILNMIPDAIPYTPGVAVPIVGTVRCGPGGLAFEDLQGAALAEVSNPSDYFYLRAEGDSMAPQIMAGDLVLVHIQPEVESGELAVVIVNGEEGMLKKYVRKDNAVILMSLNQEYPPRVFVGEEMNLVNVAGKVVESKRKY